MVTRARQIDGWSCNRRFHHFFGIQVVGFQAKNQLKNMTVFLNESTLWKSKWEDKRRKLLARAQKYILKKLVRETPLFRMLSNQLWSKQVYHFFS